MVTHTPEGPSPLTVLLQTHEGLSLPQLEAPASSGRHSPASEAAHVPTEDPALCQDISLVDSQHDLFTITSNFDAYPGPFGFEHPDFFKDFEPCPDTVLEQAWVNASPSSPGGISHFLAQFEATKRAFDSSPPPESSHKVYKPNSHLQDMITDAVHHSDGKTITIPRDARIENGKHHPDMIS